MVQHQFDLKYLNFRCIILMTTVLRTLLVSSPVKSIISRCREKQVVVGGKKVKTTKPPWEKDYLLADAGDVFGEYLEMVIQVLYHSSLNNY